MAETGINDNSDWDTDDQEDMVLRLFVAGNSPMSKRAITNLHAILEQRVKGKYKLEIVDVYQQPDMVTKENITAVPMLLKKFPLPQRLLVGDMSDENRVARGLGII